MGLQSRNQTLRSPARKISPARVCLLREVHSARSRVRDSCRQEGAGSALRLSRVAASKKCMRDAFRVSATSAPASGSGFGGTRAAISWAPALAWTKTSLPLARRDRAASARPTGMSRSLEKHARVDVPWHTDERVIDDVRCPDAREKIGDVDRRSADSRTQRRDLAVAATVVACRDDGDEHQRAAACLIGRCRGARTALRARWPSSCRQRP